MSTLDDYINYRIERAKQTFNDAKLMAENERWNSCVNRFYYACFYMVSALLVKKGISAKTHNGIRTQFFLTFVKTGEVEQQYNALYADLFRFRQQADYTDLLDFDKEKVMLLLEETEKFLAEIEKLIKQSDKN